MTPDRTYRPELPEMPARIAKLPVHRGYPVPWFVVWLDPANSERPMPRGEGVPDFRILHPTAIAEAYNRKTCWVCGEQLGKFKTFAAGPMCAVNRTSAEPPSHLECGDWSARACPFLSRPHAKRREGGMEGTDEPAGVMLRRNPGVAMVWTTKTFKPFTTDNGVLFRMGSAEHVRWYCEGRPATYAEVFASIESGLPKLKELAELQPGGIAALQHQLAETLALLPSD